MMAESTSIESRPQNGHDDYHQPRARKPNRIDLLKPHLSDERLRDGALMAEHASALSRYVYAPTLCHTHLLMNPVAAQLPSQRMRCPQYRLLRLRGK
jgi:hypothetical protein